MNFLGGLKNKISNTIYKTNSNNPNGSTDAYTNNSENNNNLDYDDLQHTLNIMQDENKFLKSKVRVLENSVFGTSNESDTNKSQFGKLFKDLKSTFSFNPSNNGKSSIEESKSGIVDFKRFLSDNLLFYNNFDEDDVDYLNNIQIKDEDWDKNKDVFIFKQKILERNYSEMFKNILVSRELDDQLNKYGAVESKRNVEKSQDVQNNKSSLNNDKIRINNKEKVQAPSNLHLETALLKDIIRESNTSINNNDYKEIINEKQSVIKIEKDKIPPVNIPIINRISNSLAYDNLLKFDLDEQEDFDLSSVLKKENKEEELKNPFISNANSENINGSKITTITPKTNKTSENNIIIKKNEVEESKDNLLSSLLLNKEATNTWDTTKTSFVNSANKSLNLNLGTKKITSNDSVITPAVINQTKPKYAWDEEEEED